MKNASPMLPDLRRISLGKKKNDSKKIRPRATRATLLLSFACLLLFPFSAEAVEIGIGYTGQLLHIEIYTSSDPDMQAACDVFNFFFSQLFFFALIALLIKMVCRTITRS